MHTLQIKDYSITSPADVPPQRWNTEELQKDFEVLSFSAPWVIVRRRSDGVKGSLEFTHSPRYYFNFIPAN